MCVRKHTAMYIGVWGHPPLGILRLSQTAPGGFSRENRPVLRSSVEGQHYKPPSSIQEKYIHATSSPLFLLYGGAIDTLIDHYMHQAHTSFPISTPSAERSFSHLQLIKTRLHNCLGELSPSHLMKIAIESYLTVTSKKYTAVTLWNRKGRDCKFICIQV